MVLTLLESWLLYRQISSSPMHPHGGRRRQNILSTASSTVECRRSNWGWRPDQAHRSILTQISLGKSKCRLLVDYPDSLLHYTPGAYTLSPFCNATFHYRIRKMSNPTPFPSLLNLSEPVLYALSFQIDKQADVLLFTLAVKPPIVPNAGSETLIQIFSSSCFFSAIVHADPWCMAISSSSSSASKE